jgi:outer membrane protein
MKLSTRSLLVLLAIPTSAWAQSSLTIEQAVQRALARAPELNAARESESTAAERVGQARSAYLPRLTAEASYLARWPKNDLPIDTSKLPAPFSGLLSISEIDDIHHVRAGVGVGMRVLDWSRGARLDAAKQSLGSERAKTQETAATLALQVRGTFLAALFARDLRRINSESLRLAESEEKRAKLRAEVGTGSQLVLAQTRVRVAGLRAGLRQAESELQRQRRLLASLLGLGEAALPELRGELRELATALPERSLTGAPVLERLRTAREAATLSARSASRTFLPTLSVIAKAEVEYPHNMRTEWGPLLQGGATLSWEFFDGGQRRAQTREAQAQARSLDELGKATEQTLRRRLIDLQARTATADADLLSAKETLEQTQIYLRVARAAVAAGTGTDLDVHNAQLGVDQAQVAIQRALLSKALARAEMLAVYGAASEGGAR